MGTGDDARRGHRSTQEEDGHGLRASAATLRRRCPRAFFISADTLRSHHDKHHKGYLDKLSALIAGSDFEKTPLEQIIWQTARQLQHQQILNNASQV